MTVNATKISAGQALDMLKSGWQAQSRGEMTVSWMMHGKPGIGKTQIAEALARFIGGKLFDVRLTTIDPSDLRGLPYYDHDEKLTKWYRPEDLPRDEKPAVLFLDELSAAPEHIQPTVYGLLQERRVGPHVLPDNVMIVAAGNRVEDGAVAYEMGTAISDRLVHLNVEPDLEDWISNYAVIKGLHPAVPAFLKVRPDCFETTEQSMEQDHLIAATPRSWERVSAILKAISDPWMRRIAIAGTLGEHICAEFFVIADDIEATVAVTEMLRRPRKDRLALYPVSMHGLQAMIFGLTGVADKDNMQPVFEILTDTMELAALRPEEETYASLPLAELTTYGFETILSKLMDSGLGYEILENPVYKAYSQKRQELGLEIA
ncbi:ATP-binding protein [Phaeobacter inhibens]|uniref:ATP-binding protein n=1 Tax=Phaeobacter inhibens TaxID=221822 RepID=UPI00248F6DB6|nr:MoxR family ATPase [Phaeobacter inhibens]